MTVPTLAVRRTRPCGRSSLAIPHGRLPRARRRAVSLRLHWPVVMATNRPTIDVTVREDFGSRVSRRLRKSGQIPGVIYGSPGGESISFVVEARALRRVLVGAGALIDLKVDGEARPVIVKAMQQHPVRGELLHID